MHSLTPPKPKCTLAPRGPWPRYTKGTGGCIKVGISLGPGWCELGEGGEGCHCGRWFRPALPYGRYSSSFFLFLPPGTSYVVCPVSSLHRAPPLSIAPHLVWSDRRGGVGVWGD